MTPNLSFTTGDAQAASTVLQATATQLYGLRLDRL